MKIFISQPMRGKTDEQIKEERDKVILKLNRRYNGDIEILDTIFDFDENTGKSEALTDILGILRQEKHINTNYFTIDDDEYDKENGRISFYITSRKTSEEYKITFDIL